MLVNNILMLQVTYTLYKLVTAKRKAYISAQHSFVMETESQILLTNIPKCNDAKCLTV